MARKVAVRGVREVAAVAREREGCAEVAPARRGERVTSAASSAPGNFLYLKEV